MCLYICVLLTIWFLNIEEGTSSSSYTARVHEFPRELSFITSSAEVFKELKVIEDAVKEYGYNLNELIREFKCSMSKSDPNHDHVATEFIRFLMNSKDMEEMKIMEEVKTIVESHPTFIFNGVQSDELFGLYISKQNKADVGVMVVSGGIKTNLVNIEVNSSTMKVTVLKTVYDLMELVRVVKAHEVSNEEVALIGFALPKLNVAGVAVEIEVRYNQSSMAFDVSCKPMQHHEFCCKLKNAVTKNYEVFKKCQKSTCKKEYLLALSQQEMEYFGENPKQYKTRFGVLFEAKGSTGEIFCFKKLKWRSDKSNLLTLMDQKVTSRHIINYEQCNAAKQVFRYKKVKYDPLSYQDAEKCLYELLQGLLKVCGVLSNKGILHNDVRVPNICFNEEYELVLIDFDNVEFREVVPPQADLQVFVDDLRKHSKQAWIKSNEFLSKLRNGKGELEDLHKSDIHTNCAMSIKEVIIARN